MRFKTQIWKTGNSFVATIPRDFVKNNLLFEGKSYEFDVLGEIELAQETQDLASSSTPKEETSVSSGVKEVC